MADLSKVLTVAVAVHDTDEHVTITRAECVSIRDANGVWHMFTASEDGNLNEVLTA